MGGDDSQKVRPGGESHSSPGRSKPPAHCKIYTPAERRSPSARLFQHAALLGLEYRLRFRAAKHLTKTGEVIGRSLGGAFSHPRMSLENRYRICGSPFFEY
jgi:hypothetical protein